MGRQDRARTADEIAYDVLQCYTLPHGDAAFIHQHVVDGWATQRAIEHTKPIVLTFALVGLQLQVVRGCSGRQVQRAHMALARQNKARPSFTLPRERDLVTVREVLAAPAGPERDRAIDAWCASVWDAFRDSHQAVADLLRQLGIE